jgi:hypothetical protein
MIGKLYDLLGKIGYIHPLHPPFTHGPIGAVIVAFCFSPPCWQGFWIGNIIIPEHGYSR